MYQAFANKKISLKPYMCKSPSRNRQWIEGFLWGDFIEALFFLKANFLRDFL